ncbi:hypothetical protein E6C60_3322 [Paenibacillus algicola]|uniref:Uncharacterized protein n=1 Tax=Paenibacillus algicola TaxID=2565926 RepID=A0A4P8XNM4_9BACL|nr:hypothetical protein E6C60_3322 [Paenibacillus algicola]
MNKLIQKVFKRSLWILLFVVWLLFFLMFLFGIIFIIGVWYYENYM